MAFHLYSLFLTVFPNTIVLHLLGIDMLMPFKYSEFMMWVFAIWDIVIKWLRRTTIDLECFV